mgnify:FL=1
MIEKTPIFSINLHTQEDFFNQEECNKIINSINKSDLLDYDFFKGDAKSTYVAMQEQKPNVLDFHKDIADKVMNVVPVTNQRLADSWCNIQGKGSTLGFHNHPNSVISGIIFLKADENSSKLVFQNPLDPMSPTAVSPHRETYELTPKTGLLAMWPSYLMHGSGPSINQSDERIVLSFNTYWK